MLIDDKLKSVFFQKKGTYLLLDADPLEVA